MTEKVASQRPQGPDKKRSFVERRQEMQNRFTVALKKARVMYRIFRLESYQFSRKVDDRLDPIADKVRYGAVRAAEAGRDAAKAGVEKAGRGVRELGRAALNLPKEIIYRTQNEFQTAKQHRATDRRIKKRYKQNQERARQQRNQRIKAIREASRRKNAGPTTIAEATEPPFGPTVNEPTPLVAPSGDEALANLTANGFVIAASQQEVEELVRQS